MSLAAPAELLAALRRAMQERGWRWYVFGAQAVLAHGRPRLTADVDAAVDPGGADPATVATALAAHGFALRVELSAAYLREARLLPMVHVASRMPLDLVIAGPGLHQELLERARLFDAGGVEVPVISAEDLVAMKILAGRRKDIEDVRGVLLQQQDRLDVARIPTSSGRWRRSPASASCSPSSSSCCARRSAPAVARGDAAGSSAALLCLPAPRFPSCDTLIRAARRGRARARTVEFFPAFCEDNSKSLRSGAIDEDVCSFVCGRGIIACHCYERRSEIFLGRAPLA